VAGESDVTKLTGLGEAEGCEDTDGDATAGQTKFFSEELGPLNGPKIAKKENTHE
jgi:hypothetical protein